MPLLKLYSYCFKTQTNTKFRKKIMQALEDQQKLNQSLLLYIYPFSVAEDLGYYI